MAALHVIAVMLTLAAVLYADEQGLLWYLGKREHLDEERLRLLHRIVSAGLLVIVASGASMVLRRPEAYVSNPIFLLKMVLVGALVVNSVFIGKISALASAGPYRGLSAVQRHAIRFSAGISFIGWAGALLCGALIGD
ncbi:MAG TPA: hypothetical protein VFP46_00645 [Candidatus Paceibacterota bacterium]|nr:hypothetical protein [Candidatus Paceibacterota bacterium]